MLIFLKKVRCGEPNSYMQGFNCKVSNSISNIPIAAPKPAVWCEGAPEKCTKGAKQIIGWHQKSGNNIQVEGYDLAGVPKSPGYNTKCGFSDGEFVKFYFFFLILFVFFSLMDGNRCPE